MAQAMMIDRYVLVGQTPVPEPDLLTWARSIEEADRHVAVTRVLDIAVVSTVFLGLDHNHMRFTWPDLIHAQPLLFESMIFWQDEGGGEMDRCSTWIQAEKMHAAMVREAASPRAVFAYVLRRLQENWQQAWNELREAVRNV